jgi:purine-cytosine permease-like protein
VIGIGVIGTALAFARAQDYLTQYLVLLGITIPPISSIYVIEALIFRRRFDEAALSGRPRIVYSAFVAWILAIVVGFLTLRGVWSITKIAALDSILVAMLVSVTLRFVETQITQRLPTPSNDQGTGLER